MYESDYVGLLAVGIANAFVGVVPILTSDIEHLLTVESSRLIEGSDDRDDMGIIAELGRDVLKDSI